jgi:hypothetical protein
MSTQKSLISVLNVCDNFRPHLSPERLVPFLLAPNASPAIGLLRPAVVAALRADNAWRSVHGHPLAWDIPASAGTGSDSESTPPYVAFAPPMAHGTPAARTRALAETLERWRAAANGGGDDDGVEGASVFSGVIGGTRWRAEWYDVYLVPGGALRTDGRDPLTVREVLPSDPGSGYVFSMERSACELFGVVTYGVHMTVYEQDAYRPDGEGDGKGQMRVWVPRRSLTKPTCVSRVLFLFFPLSPPHASVCSFTASATHNPRLYGDDMSLDLSYFRVCAGARVKLPRRARQLSRRRHPRRDVSV